MSIRPFEIENGLSLVPRIKLNLTIYPSSLTVTKPIDEWKIKRALIDFLETSLSIRITVPEEDIDIRRLKELKKRKREDPVANGALFIRDLGFLINKLEKGVEEDDLKSLEGKLLELRKYLVEKMDGLELNLEGVKFKLTVALPASDDFEGMKKAWEEFYAFGNRGYSRGGRQEPDTIILRGVPSRWFAEPRVSSKPSMLVTHTIFSTFGNIRNLNVAEDNDLGKDANEESGDLVSGLYCKIVVQFEKYRDFYDALKVLCGRSLQKQGSKMKADYDVTWDKDVFFRNSRNQTHENRVPAVASENDRSEAPKRQPYNSRYTSDNVRPRRFKE
ncbi:A-kinase anchor protein 17A [Quillaja saponaria]|uniref:A-kinase anchor protein 17A n=1 Tax=Quillaja saponaria TaxID=32244 RepID=A0AAD7VIE1_QUISA|nr:A-kinase anchor protein 17A [Quillaja saponaria]